MIANKYSIYEKWTVYSILSVNTSKLRLKKYINKLIHNVLGIY